MYVDAHCHLEDKGFNKNRDEVVNRARDICVITSGATLGGIKRALSLKKKYNIYLTLGYHPSKVKSDDKIVNNVYNLIKDNYKNILAIGEIGMDIKRDNPERQEEIFKKFLYLAKELDKPIVVHARGYEEKIFNLVDIPTMFHCYSGSLDLAKKITKEGYYISISTLLLFSEHHKMIVDKIDIDYILTETDSPYLSPFKGEKNEPKNVKLVVKEISKIKEMELDEVKRIIYNNSVNFFREKLTPIFTK